MVKYALIIIITMGLAEDTQNFELRLNTQSQLECMKDAETFQFALPMIKIETRCEPVLGEKSSPQLTGV